MLKIAICDDDKSFVSSLCNYIKDYSNEKQIHIQVYTYLNGSTLLSTKQVFHAIFLDIGMNDINGMDLAREIRKSDKLVEIIFITNYSEYREVAFSVHAFDYIEKPVNREAIFNVLDELIQYLEPNKEEQKEIKFLLKNGVKTIPVDDILYFEYMNRKVAMHVIDDKTVWLHGEKISDIAERMEPYHFAVPHKSFVVNLQKIDIIKGYDIFMINNDIIPLSQNNSKRFRKKLDIFLKGI